MSVHQKNWVFGLNLNNRPVSRSTLVPIFNGFVVVILHIKRQSFKQVRTFKGEGKVFRFWLKKGKESCKNIIFQVFSMVAHLGVL